MWLRRKLTGGGCRSLQRFARVRGKGSGDEEAGGRRLGLRNLGGILVAVVIEMKELANRDLCGGDV